MTNSSRMKKEKQTNAETKTEMKGNNNTKQ